ncbi:hypothetical protein DS885_13860 [Psychromonas sp. B3M02]|uniref:Cap15 family cyclic dinucleotide receptor domain-containing protein n=1 Tax=Psychromonas sp. B3M02 TaxID=2267226 RepID=UPI000DE8A760|nr:hypothetical protein [Psychromonas sp. B3M02]RBW43125.1 hypothetical protein DS885_13860 [Psychromonas sp. B3M02]
MWKVLPKFGLAKILVLLLCSIVTTGLIWATKGWTGVTIFFSEDGFSVISSLLIPVLICFVGITWLLGVYVWRWLWKMPVIGVLLNEKVCPDLNGSWTGKTISTYKDEQGNPYEKEVEMVIKATFFGFDIRLVSVDKYQRSTVMQSEILKDPRDGVFYLSYIFESVVDQPKETDDAKFDGAARLLVRFEDNDIKLVGKYWTNRGWQRNMQTAGTIFLQKQ